MANEKYKDIHSVTLKIKDPQLEEAYQDTIAQKSLYQYRFAIGTGILFFCVFFLVDQITYPRSVDVFNFIRVYFTLPCMLIIFLVTFTRFYKDYTRMLNILAITVAGSSVLLMAYLGSPDDPITEIYVSLILMFFYLYAFLNIAFLRTMVIGTSFVGIYLLIAWFVNDVPVDLYVNISFMLISCHIIGMTVAYRIEAQSKSEFLLRKELSETVVKDALTKLYNRYYFEQFTVNELNAFISRSKGLEGIERRHGYMKAAKYGMVMIDIDYFKRINDTFGHSTGDIVLKQIAEILKSSVRKTDDVLRFGGEEFLLIIKLTSEEFMLQFVKRLGEKIANHDFSIDGIGVIGCSVSMGLVIVPEMAIEGVEQYLRYVDRALYKSKDMGRNCGHRVNAKTDEISFEKIEWT